MEIKGKLIGIAAENSGVSKAGKEWKELSFVIETEGEHPKTVCLRATKPDLIKVIKNLIPGEVVTASINIESREFNGKWFTNINVWKVTL